MDIDKIRTVPLDNVRLVLSSLPGSATSLPRSNNCPGNCKFYTNDVGDSDEYLVEYCGLGGHGWRVDCPTEKLFGEVISDG